MADYTVNITTDPREDSALAAELTARGGTFTAEALFEETLRNLLSGLVGLARQEDMTKIVEAFKTATDAEVEAAKMALGIQFQPKSDVPSAELEADRRFMESL